MSAEAIVYGALQSLANGQVFPDIAPTGTPAPWITYRSVGGRDFTNLDGSSAPRNSRQQIDVWATSRLAAIALMDQVRAALLAAPIYAVPIGAPVSTFESDPRLFGSRLDFSVFYT